MVIKPLSPKKLGAWGEERLDAWMALSSWEVFSKNQKIWKGEIDRIYHKNSNFCVAEIKTIAISKQEQLQILCTEAGLSPYVKRHQIRNLFLISEQMMHQKQKPLRITQRLFLILKPSENFIFKIEFVEVLKQHGYFVVCQDDEGLILSLDPNLF